jgi:hypothetical protein
MNGYKAFFRNRTCEVHAATSREAQRAAASFFRACNAWEVTVILCELNGEQVTHSPGAF